MMAHLARVMCSQLTIHPVNMASIRSAMKRVPQKEVEAVEAVLRQTGWGLGSSSTRQWSGFQEAL